MLLAMMKPLLWALAAIVSAVPYVVFAQSPAMLEKAASRYITKVAWRRDSAVAGNFACAGRTEEAILGVSKTEIVVAVFVHGLTMRPEILRYSANSRNLATVKLEVESLDYDPKEIVGYDPDGFRRSQSCKGLNLSDGETDSAHIYWNAKLHKFDDWTL
jgi:hypothetical protein